MQFHDALSPPLGLLRPDTGLSMGGMQTFHVTFKHLDLFSYIGGFSGAGNVFAPGSDTLDTKTAFNGAMADRLSIETD